MSWYQWKPYVPVATRRRQAKQQMERLRKKGADIQPIEIEGRKIAKTFWGKSWCDHLEGFHDYENRLPRGRTYVRNGSVCHLAIGKGKIEAKVSGSEIYNINVTIKTLPNKKWKDLKDQSAGKVGSLIELLQGSLSDQVMAIVTDRETGLFPLTGEISFKCDCPDWAHMCKHVAAVFYGVGARLDERPELLFELRGVNHEELIDADAEAAVAAATTSGKSKRLADDDLADVFGVELDTGEPEKTPRAATGGRSKKKKATVVKVARKTGKKTTTKKATSKSTKKKVARKTAKKKAGQSAKKKTVKKSTKKTAPTKAVRKRAKKTAKKKTPSKAR